MIQTTHSLTYQEEYHFFKEHYPLQKSLTKLIDDEMEILRIPFRSASEQIFPKETEYYAPHLCGSRLNLQSGIFAGELGKLISLSDAEIKQNQSFHYLLMKNAKEQKVEKLIILFHGLNEKDWTKYLPWAKKLLQLTGKAVLMFPIAFHIDRAFPTWQEARAMNEISKKRQELFLHIRESSFINSAMSTRLHFAPSRFFLSGLETYSDVIELVKSFYQNQSSYVSPNVTIDFLGYSAGAFLAQILLMANRDGMFGTSKALLFCGGVLLSRMYLTSRYIMDSEAHQAIKDYYIDNFDRNLQNDAQMNHLYEATQKGGQYFRSMLSESYGNANVIRKTRLEELSKQLMAIALEKDEVMPPQEIQASLLGNKGSAVIPCKVMDFEHPYSHVLPFVPIEKIQQEVQVSFEQVMNEMANFLG